MTETIMVQARLMPHAQPECCITNVQQAVAMHGGAVVTGWRVTDHGPIRELRHHAVWQMPEELGGELREITPTPAEIIGNQVLVLLQESQFLPDPTAIFENNEAMHNKYKPNMADPRLLDACKMLSEADKYQYQGRWDQATYWNAKANKIIGKHGGGFLDLAPRAFVEKSKEYQQAVTAADKQRMAKEQAINKDQRKRKKQERQRRKANR